MSKTFFALGSCRPCLQITVAVRVLSPRQESSDPKISIGFNLTSCTKYYESGLVNASYANCVVPGLRITNMIDNW